MFERADTDGSGGLSEAEMRAAHDVRRAKMKDRGGREARHGRRGPSRGMAMLRRADANGDKIVTRAEFDAAAEARFNRADTDGSGVVTAEERQAAREARKANREERRSRR